MKQNITLDQLKELEGLAAKRYVDWMVEKDYDFSKGMTIGQMIEFLEESTPYTFTLFRRALDWKIVGGEDQEIYSKGFELTDCLWEAVQEILEK